MTNQENRPKDALDLRQKAEALARKQAGELVRNMETASLSAQTPEEIQQVLHELRVHQIELEMQNEELRRAQAEIEAGQARYFDLYDLAPVGYCTLSGQGLILEANLTAATLVGMTRGALVKQPISRFILKEDQDIYYLHRKKLFETGEPQECDLRLVKADGTLIWAHLTATAVQAEDGAPLCRVVISDITERKMAGEALRKSERHLKSTVDGLSAHIAVLDGQGEIILTNKSYRDFGERNGIDPSTVSEGVNYLAVCDTALGEHSEEARSFAEGIREVLSGKRPSFELEYPCHSPDEKRWFIGRVTLFTGEGPRRVVVAHENITERKRAEENLRKSEAKYRDLFDSNRDGIIRTELDGSIIEVNQMFLEITGYESFDDLKGSYQELTPEKWDDLEADIVRNQVIERGYSDEYEKEYIHRNGTVFPIRIKVWLIKDNDQAVGMWGIVRDITERKQVEEALNASQAQLSTALEIAHLGHWEYDVATDLFTFNDHFYKIFRTTVEQVGSYTMHSAEYARRFVHPDDSDMVWEETQKAIETTDPHFNRQIDARILYADGTPGYIIVRFLIVKDSHGRTVKTYGVNQDITDRKLAEEALRSSEQEKSMILENVGNIIAYHKKNGGIVWANQSYLDSIGYITGSPVQMADVKGRRCYELWKLGMPCVGCPVDIALQNGKTTEAELSPENQPHWPATQGSWYIKATPIRDTQNNVIGAIEIAIDITERKRAETYRDMGREILQILNEPGGLQESIQRVLAALKARTGVDAVGLRLQEGEDFPYFVQDGFSEDFLLTENTLVERGKDGGVCRDKDGNVNLECMCGNIIRGRYDSSLPFFSDNGSFWTHSTSELLASTSEENRQARTRNRCNRDGYESVALIPVRTTDRIVGLIQLNDKRKGRFTPETIEILEGLAAHIGSALMRKGAERNLEEKMHELGRFNKLMTGRELKMIELKEEINHLMEKLGLPAKYRGGE